MAMETVPDDRQRLSISLLGAYLELAIVSMPFFPSSSQIVENASCPLRTGGYIGKR